MKILIVASYNNHSFAPFVTEQVEAVERLAAVEQVTGVEVRYFGVARRGVKGYLQELKRLRREIRDFQPDIVHAHYGLSGLLANLQRRVPVVTTFHGSDINQKSVRRMSQMAMHLSAWNIFVSERLRQLSNCQHRYSVIPCGVSFGNEELVSRVEAREQMGLYQQKRYILFAGAFDNEVKNAKLAFETIKQLLDEDVELLELRGYSRHEVWLMLRAVDVLLLTSHTEGSPQVVKEAMAADCAVVSVDVGDVKERVGGLSRCFVAKERNAAELAEMLHQALMTEPDDSLRQAFFEQQLDSETIAKKILGIYKQCV